jgi:peptide/nickel transport system substrate-binding protein
VEWTFFGFDWNLKTPFFSDIRVRKAMSYAFDYREMLDKLFYGLYEQSNGIFHPTSWMAPKKPLPFYKQNLDKAEELLDAAGWEDHDNDGIRDKKIDGKLVKFEFSILTPPAPDRVKLCTLLKENLSQIGIICNVRPLEATVMLEKVLKHEFQAAFGGWGTGSDPDTSDNIWATGQGRNFGNYSNPKVDELYKKGRLEFDRKKRGEIYAQIDTLIYEDQPYTFLYYRNAFYAFNRSLRGYNFSPRGPFHYGPGFSSIYKVKN